MLIILDYDISWNLVMDDFLISNVMFLFFLINDNDISILIRLRNGIGFLGFFFGLGKL